MQVAVKSIASLYRLTDRLYRAQGVEDLYEATLDAIAETMGSDRASILLFDAEKVMQFVAWRGLSDDYRQAVNGHTPWTVGQRGAEPIYVDDIRLTSEPEWLKKRILSEDIRSLAFIPLTARGGVIGKFMLYHAQVHEFTPAERDIALTIARQLGFGIERHRAEEDRLRATRDLEHSEERCRLMSEDAPVMIWTSDAAGRCRDLNKVLRKFWNVKPEDIDSFDWSTTIHPADAERVIKEMTKAIQSKRAAQITARYRRADGEYRILQTEARPILDRDGVFGGMIGVNLDVTEREAADQRRILMVDELNHRVKNTLAMVRAIARQTFKRDLPTASLATFNGRLQALAEAHTLLSNGKWESANLSVVAAEILSGSAGRVNIQGPAVSLNPKQAITMAIALHELQTNALKYGALSNDEGRIEFNWHVDRQRVPNQLTIKWQELNGPRIAALSSRGFGTVMIDQAIREEFDAEVSLNFRPEGLICTIVSPYATIGP